MDKNSNNSNVIEDKIIITTKGIGFIKNPNSLQEDILIEELDLNKALNGDKVRIKLKEKTPDDNPRGIVVTVLERHREQFVCSVLNHVNKPNELVATPANKKIHVDFELSKEDQAKIKIGEKILVQMTDWPEDAKNPNAKIIKIFGEKGNHEVEMQSIIFDKGFQTEFDPKIEAEAEKLKQEWHKIPESEIAKRLDMRGNTTMTIDPFDAKDFDDALSIKKLENGNYEIGVHIADVSHYVTPGSELDKEAIEREFSVYLVDRTIPMLPEVLSNDLCSLNPNEEKLAFSAIFEITDNAEVLSRKFAKTIIKSDKRFTYEEAQAILDAEEGPHVEDLITLNKLAKKFTKIKNTAGAINFEKDEIKFELDKDGRPIRIIKKERMDTHKLVEEFMLLANREVAKYIHDKNKEFGNNNEIGLMYRSHDVPNTDRISELALFVKALGYKLPLSEEGAVTAMDLNALLQEVEGKAEETLVKSAAIKTMSKAIYSTESLGHFGLAFEYYTHFTSPIRRYPDLIVHRILHSFIQGKPLDQETISKLSTIANKASEREVSAAEAERESIKYKQAEFMQDHIGQEFEGVISGVSPWGLYVTENNTLADGLIHISKLGGDFYKHDEKTYSIIGERTGKKFTLGDPIKIKIDAIDLDKRQIDLSIVE